MKRLVRELRKETCPQSVIDKVEQRRSASAPPPGRLRYTLAGIGAVLAMLCVLTVWQRPDGGGVGLPVERAGHSNTESTHIARQAEGSLGLIGSILLDAGARSGSIILKGAVEPMQNSLQTAKNKIQHQIQK